MLLINYCVIFMVDLDFLYDETVSYGKQFIIVRLKVLPSYFVMEFRKHNSFPMTKVFLYRNIKFCKWE